VVIAIAVLVLSGPLSVLPAVASAEDSIRVLRVPGEGLFPQARVDDKGVLHLTYFKGDPGRGDIFYVRSADAGRSFSRPIRVNSQAASAIVAGMVRGPQMALGRNGRVHVAWMGSNVSEPKAPGGHTPMLYARLNDGGDGFEPQRNVIQKHPGLDGGGSIAADGKGNVYVTWHAPTDIEAKAGEAGRRVWISRSNDDGRTFDVETAADASPAGTCGCCGMAAWADHHGRVYVLYRTASAGVNRDTRLLGSDDGGKSFKILAEHPWPSSACMMSTPGFADGANAVAAAWETQKQVYFTRIDPAALKSAPPTAPPGDGSRKHPRLAVNGKGQALVAWAEGTGWNKGGAVAWQLFGENGQPVAGGAGKQDGLPVWSAPAAVALPDGRFLILY